MEVEIYEKESVDKIKEGSKHRSGIHHACGSGSRPNAGKCSGKDLAGKMLTSNNH